MLSRLSQSLTSNLQLGNVDLQVVRFTSSSHSALSHAPELSLSPLPFELHELIISHINDSRSLFSLLTCSRSLLRLAEKGLYNHIEFKYVLSSTGTPLQLKPKLRRRYNALIWHLSHHPRHASLVRYLDWTDCDQRSSDQHWWGTFVAVVIQQILPHLPNLHNVSLIGLDLAPSSLYEDILRQRLPATTTIQELFIHSSLLDSAISSSSIDGLFRRWISEQQNLNCLRVIPDTHRTRQRAETEQTILRLPLLESLTAIEGSWWLFSKVLPSTVRPIRMRFWCGESPILGRPAEIPTDFKDRFSNVRILSMCLPLDKGGWQKAQFLDVTSALDKVEILELKFTSLAGISLIEWIVSHFHGSTQCPGLCHLIISTSDQPLWTKQQVKELFAVLDAFEYIPRLQLLDIRVNDCDYVRATRNRRTPGALSGVVHREDWWLYV